MTKTETMFSNQVLTFFLRLRVAIQCFYYMIVRLVDAKLFYVKNLEGSFCTDLWRSGGG